LIPVNMHKSQRLMQAAQALYDEMCAADFDVLFDDRNLRPGVMFADQELIGIPYRIVLSERALDAGRLEYQGRSEVKSTDIAIADTIEFLRARMR
jgi:prolyl-tRNA synthetase